MNIQNKKFLLNLGKIQLSTEKILQGFPHKPLTQGLNTIFLIFFILSNSGPQFVNSLFLSAKQLRNTLQQTELLSIILTALMLLLNFSVLIALFYLCKDKQTANQNFKKTDMHVSIHKIGAISLILFQFCCLPLLVAISSSIDNADTIALGLSAVGLLCMILSQIIIVFCKISTPFTKSLMLVLLAFRFLPPLSADFIITLLTLYEIRNKTGQRLVYCLILGNITVCLCGEYLQVGISTFHQILIIAAITIIERLLPNSGLLCRQQENQIIIDAVAKMGKNENLSIKQIINILTIFESMLLKFANLEKIVGNKTKRCLHIAQFQQISLEDFTKAGLIRLLRLKLEGDLSLSHNNVNIKIQQYQCNLLEQDLSISTLYDIKKLSQQVYNRNNYEEIVRFERLMGKVEGRFTKGEDQINARLIFHVQKMLEEFYMNVGMATEQLLALWNTLFRKGLNEDIFDACLQKVMNAQSRSFQIVRQLQSYKNVSLESDIVNFLHRLINANSSRIFQRREVSEQERVLETQFLLVGNNLIEDASLTVIKKLAHNQEEHLIGTNINELLYEFYSIYLQQHINKMTNTSQVHVPLLIAFKVLNHKFKFSLFQCVIRVLPDFSQGVKCIFQFLNQRQDSKKYCLYCLDDDIVYGLSESFFENFRVDDSCLPPVICGRDLFNVDISFHTSEQDIVKDFTVRGQLVLDSMRKKLLTQRKSPPIPIYLKIRESYKVKGRNYVLFEMATQEETIFITPKQTIKLFVTENKDLYKTTVISTKNPNFCKIHNPLTTVIDQKLSKIIHNDGISYFKIVIGLMVVMLLVVAGMLVFIKVETATAGLTFSKQMQLMSNTNSLIQQMYLLFYQYFQYYQITNYPQQILQIQYYNMTAIIQYYKSKVNNNIMVLLQTIINDKGDQTHENYNIFYGNYVLLQSTKKFNLVSFLEDAKLALSTNIPYFMVRNENVIGVIIDSFIPPNNLVILEISQQLNLGIVIAISLVMFLCVTSKIINYRICVFKWNILQLYSAVAIEEREEHIARLQSFITVLTSHQYYDKKNKIKITNSEYQTNSSANMDAIKPEPSLESIESIQSKNTCYGINRSTYFEAILKNNILFLIPLILLVCCIIYNGKIEKFIDQSGNIIKYSSQLQNSSVLMLQRGTSFMKISMDALLPEPQRPDSIRQNAFTISTEIGTQLPEYFNDYKSFEKGMLDFNLCDYSYLNTGSLYRGINCSEVLDGMMNQGFTETYTFLLQKIEQLGGTPIQDLGEQFRPNAKYPFFMEVYYARRTIDDMLAVVQTYFANAVDEFLDYKQGELQSTVNVGFAFFPLALVSLWIFGRRLRADCQRAIKSFRILPRCFIMKLSTSKRLHSLSALQEIELVAP